MTSAHDLVEALVFSTDRALVRQARSFVDSLRGEHVTPEYARLMQKHCRRPMRGRHRGPRPPEPSHRRTCVAQLTPVEWSEAEQTAHDKGEPVARRRLKSSRRFEVDNFSMQGAAVRRLMHRYDLVVQVLRQSPRRVLVSPPERVLHLQHYENGRSLGSVVFTEKPGGLRRRTLRDVRRSLGRDAAPLQRKSYLSLLRDANFVHELFQLWPRHS